MKNYRSAGVEVETNRMGGFLKALIWSRIDTGIGEEE